MKRLLLILLACAPAFSQLSNVDPYPDENLITYQARMEAYFAPQIANRGLEALLRDEGSDYNAYRRFLSRWESRLYPHGDFKIYFQQEAAWYNRNKTRRRRSVAHQQNAEAAATSGGAWQEIGPIAKPTSNVGGEGTGPTEFITFYDPAPSRMLCGSNAGGLFYSTNSGVFWTKTGTDTLIGRSGVGTAVFHPTDYKTWFAASAGNSGSGNPEWIGYSGGIFRTRDEGATWKQIATEAQLGGLWTRIFKIANSPDRPNQLWAATSNGLFRTNNALATTPTWIAIPQFTGQFVWDLEIRPNDSNWIYVTSATSSMTNWRFVASNTNGSTWSNLPAQPASVATAAALTIEVSKAKADNLYGFVVAPNAAAASELYLYDFGTSAWNLVYGTAQMFMGSGHAFGVDQFNPNEIFLGEFIYGRRYTYQGSPLFINFLSRLYGGTYHDDIEDLVPHPVNPNEVWMCHHGGVSVSTDNGVTWSDRSTGLGVSQVWSMATSTSDPGYVALGLYHEGTIGTTSPWYELWSPAWKMFQSGWCDGQRPLIDPTTPQYIWHSCQWGNWYNSSDFGLTFSAQPPVSPNWVVNGVLNRLDPKIQYRLAFDVNSNPTIARTMDRGTSWTVIADFATLYPPSSYEYLIFKVYAPETNGDHLLVHLIEMPVPNVNNDWWRHHLYRTKIANAAAASVIASWQELQLPVNGWPPDIDFDPLNPNIVYVINGSSNYTANNPTGTQMVYRVDYTNPALSSQFVCNPAVCTDLTQNLPNGPVGGDGFGVELNSNGGLYIATDLGTWYSNNATRAAGNGWSVLGTELPNVAAAGLELNYVNRKVRVATFGRGAWEHDLVPTASASCLAPPTGMTVWWTFDEFSGPTSNDRAGTNNAGTQIGSPPVITGKVSRALHFNGSVQYVSVPSQSDLDLGTGDFTIDAWVRTSQGNVRPIVDKRNLSTIGYTLFTLDGRLGFQMGDRAGSAACSTNNTVSACTNWIAPPGYPNVADGQWHHVAVTVDRDNPNGGGVLYVDGWKVLVFDPTIRNLSIDSTVPLWIGSRQPTTVSGSAFWNGDIDEVEIFKRALAASEIQGMYNAGSLGKCKCTGDPCFVD